MSHDGDSSAPSKYKAFKSLNWTLAGIIILDWNQWLLQEASHAEMHLGQSFS